MAELYIFGMIKKATGFKNKNLNVQFQIQHGDGWTLEGGALENQSQFDYPQNAEYEGHIFMLPFEAGFKVVTLTNLPIVKFTLNTMDQKKLKQLVGQTELFVPLRPGRQLVKLDCWRVSRAEVQRAEGPGKAQPGGSVVYDGDRSCLMTESAGTLELELQIVQAGFGERGIVL